MFQSFCGRSRYSDLALRVLAVAVGCIQQPPLDVESEERSGGGNW